MAGARDVLDEAWREHAAGMLGVLARRLGELDRAGEALQDAVAEALKRWPGEGVPGNPAGWLVTAAWRKVEATRRALALATNAAERELLTRRLASSPLSDAPRPGRPGA
jgi:predicted RNA polymerase sigma factor